MRDGGRALWGLDGPFFAPLWRRVALVVFTAIWAAAEAWNGATLWAALFAGIAAVMAWQFFIVNDYGAPPGGAGKDQE